MPEVFELVTYWMECVRQERRQPPPRLRRQTEAAGPILRGESVS